jgi:DHA1 family bicyclomycin/chloramphenicol resistance-like MFS transporter
LLGWQWVFVVLILLNLCIMAGVYFLLPESKTADPGFSLRAGAILNNFWNVLQHPQFYTYAITGAIAYGGLSAYVSGSPYVFMEIFRVNEKQYGWIFAIIALGIISASQLSNLALKKYSSENIIRSALACQTIIGTAFAVLAYFGLSEIFSTILLIFLFLACQGFIFPNASALSLAPFAHNAGNASALMGAIQMGIGAGASALVSVLENHTAFPMAAVMACCSMSAFLVFMVGRRRIGRRPRAMASQEEDLEMISTL